MKLVLEISARVSPQARLERSWRQLSSEFVHPPRSPCTVCQKHFLGFLALKEKIGWCSYKIHARNKYCTSDMVMIQMKSIDRYNLGEHGDYSLEGAWTK